jgi:UDP-2,3-diacylglucosamine pyrophosphatase LpxH
MQPDKKIYFLSDFHLGVPDHATSLVRERRIVEFLEEIRKDAAVIFIVGDMFDFWYEYRTVVPTYPFILNPAHSSSIIKNSGLAMVMDWALATMVTR